MDGAGKEEYGRKIWNKRGDRAKLLYSTFRELDETAPVDASAEELATKYAMQRRFEKLAVKPDDRHQP